MSREVYVRFCESLRVKFPLGYSPGGVMVLTALIQDDRELDRILGHQGWPADFPKTSPARAPPAPAADQDDAGPADPRSEQEGARQDWPAVDWPV